MPARLRYAVAVGVLAATSCTTSDSVPAASVPAAAGVEPAARAVQVVTSACGHASRTSGSGVAVGEGRVLTVAHVAVGASSIVVTDADGTHDATIVHLDLTRDLAVLAVPAVDVPPIDLGDTVAGAFVTIVDAKSSGTVSAVVRRRVVMDIDDVRGTDRHQRDGYELDAEIAGGDSGAGVFDDRGRLVAVVFAEPTERDAITYAVGGAELAVVLSADERQYACDPARSLVVDVAAERT